MNLDPVVSADRLAGHITALTAHGPRCGDLPGVTAALRYMSDTLRDAGLRVTVERYGSELYDVNLVAEIPGASPDAIELCAHWDTTPDTVGADDNASGVAGVLEAARLLRGLELPARTVRFCLFGGEETGFLGSSAHVRGITPGTESIVFEMIGYTAPEQGFPPQLAELVDPPSRGDFIALVGEPDSMYLVHNYALHASLPVFPFIVPVVARDLVMRSDHVPYWESRRHSVLVTDTADFRNPHYHRPTDTIDTLDLPFAAGVVEAAVRTINAAAYGR
ncbi:M20/M25/M40 family metallo-hydrolase [Dactylosporangium sp. AC04546]|uniref:M20/M25/M40 family metallo-hydrolase n=1 Tax=Dactylosporangium sp. AC04546 TaxID=2862460 RepID=UPI001EDF7217|nr:M20/M25/M40 family metallo-hydrolase [Dactylosporangium sp. AC04546]WVK82877.1 M20/M25/M40 family metallo-hydrolase [Dactylosporangium sp. AC04546]